MPNLKRLQSLSHLLDNAIPIPGTSYRVGLDPILGFIPAAGDYVSAGFSGYILLEAAKMGVPKATLVRMLLNIVADTLVGTIPVLGDIFDFAWKANQRNLILLESHLASPQSQSQADQGFVWLLLAGLFLLVTILLLLTLGGVVWVGNRLLS
ncbi:DUF4112 domain-containing protein [Spirulina sp. CS-785/01]|uniref:DUF4112 domain-containing protein n=1 Tax=Spirulina sp. CS-785/01 TaxID=3021716 RepID=UPI00232CEF72|nr:DUF4112 domain-containing protein [Spirulina sp. CS-785/01]MDB9315509.1 DUF4112 domain-containing protein [Spirulina sp. CS-785/01]